MIDFRRYSPLIWLAIALILLYAYGSAEREVGRFAEQEKALKSQITNAGLRVDSAKWELLAAQKRADSLERRVAAFQQRRVRAVASTDSVLAEVDSILPALPDTLRPVVESLLATVRTERLASDSVILSLEQTVEAKNLALAKADSLISARQSELSAAYALVKVLEREAHPSFLRRVLVAGKWVAVGVGAALVWVAVR